jgi:hypothetical protein
MNCAAADCGCTSSADLPKSEQPRLHIVPLTLKQANEMVADLHRHHKPVVGHRFSLAASWTLIARRK